MKLSIGKRLSLGFGGLLIIVLVFGIYIIVMSQKNKNVSEKIINVYTPSKTLLNDYYTTIDNSKMLIKSWVFIDKLPDTKDKLRLVNLHDSIYPALVKEIDQIKEKWEPGDRSLMDEILKTVKDSLFVEHKTITTDLGTFEAYNDGVLLFLSKNKVEYDGEVIILTDRILKKIAALQGKINELAAKANETLKSSNRSFQTSIYVLLAILLITATVAALLTSRSILIPVNRLNNTLNLMSKGEMPEIELVDTGDEIGEMSMSLKNVVNELRKIIAEIKDSALFLSNHSKTLTRQAKILSTGAGEQATYVQEINASIEKILASLDMNAENSKLAETLVLNFVSSIQNNSTNVSKTFDALNKISQKVNDVNDIAFQTNILSLNAAIEAARAGEQGKGFGIVAQEVGKLAERSKIHANEIEDLSAISLNIAKTTDEVSSGLIPQIHKTQELIGTITGAISDLSSGVNVIHKTAVNLNGIALQNSNFSGDMSQNSKDLELQVAKLMQSVSFFKISQKEMASALVDKKEPNKKEALETVNKTEEKKEVEKTIEPKPEEKKSLTSKNEPGFKLDFDVDFDDNFETF